MRKLLYNIVINQVLEYANSYDKAVEYLTKVHLVSPVYFIIAGTKPKEGVVITRDRMKPANIWTLESSNKYAVIYFN